MTDPNPFDPPQQDVTAPAEPTPPPPPPTAGPVHGAGPGPLPGGPPPGYLVPAVPVFPNGKPMLDAQGVPVSDKSRLAAALLCWFVGFLGIHRFYVGKVGTGIAMIVTCGGLGVWVLVDLELILLGSFRDESGRALENW